MTPAPADEGVRLYDSNFNLILWRWVNYGFFFNLISYAYACVELYQTRLSIGFFGAVLC